MIEKIKKAIEKEAMKTGAMGIEPVNIILKVTESDREEFLKECDQLDDHWNWEFDGDELNISYVETIEKYAAQKKYMAKLKKVNFRVKPEIYEEYAILCKKNGTKPTTELRKFIDDYIEKHQSADND